MVFLTKAVVVAISILALVQLIAATEVCYLDSDLASLPEDVRRLLVEDSHRLDSLRCPYSRCQQRGRDLCCCRLKRWSIRRLVITEKAPTRAFSWLKAATTAFTSKTLRRHYAKRALTPR